MCVWPCSGLPGRGPGQAGDKSAISWGLLGALWELINATVPRGDQQRSITDWSPASVSLMALIQSRDKGRHEWWRLCVLCLAA